MKRIFQDHFDMDKSVIFRNFFGEDNTIDVFAYSQNSNNLKNFKSVKQAAFSVHRTVETEATVSLGYHFYEKLFPKIQTSFTYINTH